WQSLRKKSSPPHPFSRAIDTGIPIPCGRDSRCIPPARVPPAPFTRRRASASAFELVPERRVYVLTTPARIRMHVVFDQMCLTPHPEPLAQANRRFVLHVEPGEQPVRAEPVEGQGGQGAGRLSCIALPLVTRMEHPADLDLLRRGTRQPADHLADDR